MAKVGFLDEIDMAVIRGDEGKSRKKSSRPARIMTCADCRLDQSCQTPKMPVYGNGKKRIMIILDTPSTNEDERGEPYTGPRGLLFEELLEDRLGIKVKRDCWTIFAVRCCTKKSIKPYNSEPCRRYIHSDIEELNPAVIIPVGYWAFVGLVGDKLLGKHRGRGSGDWAGHVIPDQYLGKWVCPTWDLFLLNLETNKPDSIRIEQLVQHFDRALSMIDEPVQVVDYNKKVKILPPEKVLGFIIDLWDRAKASPDGLVLALDYETTGRKPHRKGHKIISISISNGKKTWVFDYDSGDNVIKIQFGVLLRCKQIKWRVHNLQFEWLWSFNMFNSWPANLDQDTILGIHIWNGQKRVGLKINAYALFGVAGYDNDIEEYISAPSIEEKAFGANAFNLMEQAPQKERLTYNALDTLFTYHMAEWLNKNLPKSSWVGYRFFMESAINLSKAQQNGIRVDTKGVGEAKDVLTAEMESLEKNIQRLAVKGGWQKGLPFRPSAADDISSLVYDIMGNEPSKMTNGDKPSTDKEALERINHPVIAQILEWKKLQKLRDTYLNGMVTEVVDEYMHPFFNLYTVVTYRSSSNDPNFQNIPVRDKMASQMVRSLLFPRHGHRLCEYDYKGIEVVVAGCYTKDPNLIKYVSDKSTDMHRDTGIELFMYEDNPQDFSKFDRGIAKNKFVFPEFYGSYFEQCAADLWHYCSPEAKANLKKNGVRNLKDYNEHVREVEKSFWEVRFRGYAQWKKDIYKQFLRKGYIDTYTGFRLYGPMNKKEVTNYAIQGSAHHVLLKLFNHVSDVVVEKKMQSCIIGQIHDSLLNSTHPDEEKYLDKMIWHYGTQTILNDWKWLIIPVEIEKAAGEIDRPWSEVEELGMLGINGKVVK